MGKPEPREVEKPPELKPSEVSVLYLRAAGDMWDGNHGLVFGRESWVMGYRTKEAVLAASSEGDVILTVQVLERSRKRVHTCAESF